MFFKKYKLFSEKMFLYGKKKFDIEKYFYWKKLFLTEKNLYQNYKNIFLIWEICLYTENISVTNKI